MVGKKIDICDFHVHVEGGINRDLESARLWFKENGMMPNPKKYQLTVLGRKVVILTFNVLTKRYPRQMRLTY